MVKSMTGFGQGEAGNRDWWLQVEIRALNHRYLDLAFRIPKQYSQLEEPLRLAIQEKVARGRLEVTVNMKDFGEKGRKVTVNKSLLQGYLEALREIQDHLGSQKPVGLEQLLLLPDLLTLEDPELDWESLEEVFLEAVDLALRELELMRRTEGEKLALNLQEKAASIERLVEEIAFLAPQVAEDYKKRLQERLGDLLDGTNITEERFLGEIAIFADKCSIDEELVRFDSHVQQFKKFLLSNQPVGRKLEFLLQEMNREVNTIGAKGNQVTIAGLVVEIKSELEKMREQVQNIE
ncbi:MAG: YicC family protein [Firmicutes bacterium]|nr:YicC family protein [Bacillota bacterium]